MRNVLPLVLILVAALLGVWLLLDRDDALPTPAGDPAEEDGAAGETPPPGLLEASAPDDGGLRVKGTAPEDRRRPPPVAVDWRKLPQGALSVTMLGPDLKPFDAGDLRVFVEPVARGAWPPKLGDYLEEEFVWRFERVVAGVVRVRVEGDHVIARTVDARVKRDRDNALSVTLDRAGSIRYDVIAYDKTRPEKVKLTLQDAGGEPVRAWYQERSARRMTTPQQFETAEIGPVGVVFGILPGRYRLRVVSSFDEWDDAEVEVLAGETAKVSLEVRR